MNKPQSVARALIVGALVTATLAAMAVRAGDSSAGHNLPGYKQTSLALYATSREAYEMWQAAPDEVKVLDVRTPEEYIFVGHAEMAWNIPLRFQSYRWDAEKERFALDPNPHFVDQVKAWAKPGDTLLVMCRSGGRSAAAVDMLAGAGFTRVYSITDGMEGDAVEDPQSAYHGKPMRNGWKNAGLPWTYAVDPRRVLVSVSP